MYAFNWQEKKKEEKRESDAIDCLVYEIHNNKCLVERFAQELDVTIAEVENGTKPIYVDLPYEKIAFFHSKEFYQKGLAAKNIPQCTFDAWQNCLSNVSGRESTFPSANKNYRSCRTMGK